MKVLIESWGRFLNENKAESQVDFIEFDEAVQCFAWHPSRYLLAVATDQKIFLYEFDPESFYMDLMQQWTIQNFDVKYFAWSESGNILRYNKKHAIFLNNQPEDDPSFDLVGKTYSYDKKYSAIKFENQLFFGEGNFKQLSHIKTPEEAYEYAEHHGPHDILRLIASKDTYYAYNYALYIDEGPHEVTRQGASESASYADLYARNIDKKDK